MALDETYIKELKIWFLFSYTFDQESPQQHKIYNRLEVT